MISYAGKGNHPLSQIKVSHANFLTYHLILVCSHLAEDAYCLLSRGVEPSFSICEHGLWPLSIKLC